MWKNKKREQTEHPERGTGCSIRKQGMLLACALLGILLCGPLSGCGQEKVAETEASEKKSEATLVIDGLDFKFASLLIENDAAHVGERAARARVKNHHGVSVAFCDGWH